MLEGSRIRLFRAVRRVEGEIGREAVVLGGGKWEGWEGLGLGLGRREERRLVRARRWSVR